MALNVLRCRRGAGPGREAVPPTKCLRTRFLVPLRTSPSRRWDILRAELSRTTPGSTGDAWRSHPL